MITCSEISIFKTSFLLHHSKIVQGLYMHLDSISKIIRGKKLFFIAGPCVIESESLCLRIAERLARCADRNKIDMFFKASWDKANRTSKASFRGPGRQKGLQILSTVREKTGLPLLTDIHETCDVQDAADVVDIIQIPAFLCRQTDLLEKAGKTNKWVNVKKGQFMAPLDMRYAIDKIGDKCILTERGTFFGYNRLVVDFTGIAEMKSLGVPVVFDATHSIQNPGGLKGCSGGNRNNALPLAQAAVCHHINGLFFEVHPDPSKALCDGPNSLYLSSFEKNLPRLIELHSLVHSWHP